MLAQLKNLGAFLNPIYFSTALILIAIAIVTPTCQAGTLTSAQRYNYRPSIQNYSPRSSGRSVQSSTAAARWANPLNTGGSHTLESSSYEGHILAARRTQYEYQLQLHDWKKQIKQREFELAKQARERRIQEAANRKPRNAPRNTQGPSYTRTYPGAEPSLMSEGLIGRVNRRAAMGRTDSIFFSTRAPQPETTKTPGFWQRLKKSLFG